MLTPDEIIDRLKPCHYRHNGIKNLGDKINFGFIAQDILKEFGDEYNFVQKDKEDEFLTVNYAQFIAPIVSVVKSQQEEINSLKKEVAEQKQTNIEFAKTNLELIQIIKKPKEYYILIPVDEIGYIMP